MKNIFFKILGCTLLVALIGCTKDLDLSPMDTISDASFWKTPADFQKGANTLYAALSGFENFDVDADIAFNNPNTISNSTHTTPENDNDWNNAYTRIRNCNNVMERAAASSIEDQIKVYVAEAKFFRAYNYWMLYRKFGGVPIVSRVLDISSEELYSPRNTPQETVDFILQNLAEAIPDLPERDQLSAANMGRITKGAALALRARVALYEGTWRKFRNESGANDYLDIAIEASNAVITSGKHTLYKGSDELSYRLLFDEEGKDCTESILARRYQSYVSAHSWPQSMQMNGLSPTKQLADMYLCMDGLPVEISPLFEGYETRVSEFENRDPRMMQTIMIPGTEAYAPLMTGLYVHWPFYPDRVYNTGYIIWKYKCQNPLQDVPYNNQQQFDRHIIRYAEVLLIHAEATFERTGSVSDDVLNKTINVLRDRAGLTTPLTNAFVTENGLDMRAEIRRERTVELAIEGYRRDDLKRWKTAETELVKDIRGIKIVGTEWTEPIYVNDIEMNPYRQPSWQNRTDADGFLISEAASARNGFDPNKHYRLPIPARQINLNPNLEQNPGW